MGNFRYIKCFLSENGDIVEKGGFIEADSKKKARVIIRSCASSGLVESSCIAVKFPTSKKQSDYFIWQKYEKAGQSTIGDFTSSVIDCTDKSKNKKSSRLSGGKK